MKNLFRYLLGAAVCISASCGNKSNNTTATTSDSAIVPQAPAAAVSGKHCFLRVSGGENRDTASVQVSISNNEVSGTYSEAIYGKDSRKGTLKGTLKDSVITASWYFMQEGMNDTLPAVFKLGNGLLTQKTYSYDAKTGRQFVADTNRFTVGYIEVPCK
ncbi:hypothetical protein [Deminuibacter soli]|uniref:Lipoprotein n=1 Tax=Deminuibacter soli TaxID=2291815 RepID=A0A3E1NDW2_9BACT|nr:hypothetical protein [Deminuibacter soli]RFM26146.1 hypothetical protein DXN05_21325 [Deminuibacter soli]